MKGRDLLDSIESEAKEALNFKEISTKPMKIVPPEDDSGESEEATEVVEDKGEDVVEEGAKEVPTEEVNEKEVIKDGE